MTQTIHAIFENGIFRPVEPVNLPDRRRKGSFFFPMTKESAPCFASGVQHSRGG
jgi:hypothetical protein